MAAPDLIDQTTASLLAGQAAKDLHQIGVGQTFVMEQARMAHLRADREVGMREATAAQELRTSAQAREILQANAAANQPVVITQPAKQ